MLFAGCGDDGGGTADAAIDAPVIDALAIDAPMVDAMAEDAMAADAMAADAMAADAMVDATPPDAMPDAMVDAMPPDAMPPDADTAAVLSLAPVDDATLCDPAGAIGIGDLFVGTTNQPTHRRALVRFDLSTLPVGATLLSAELQLTVGTSMGSRAVDLHRVTTDWNEGSSTPTELNGGGCGVAASDDATWANTGLGGTWTTAGGDFAATASATSADVDAASLTSALMLADVAGWVATPGSNLGWILRHPLEGTQGNVMRLTSSATRLVVRYLP